MGVTPTLEEIVQFLQVVADLPDWWENYAGSVVKRYQAERLLGRDVSTKYHLKYVQQYEQAVEWVRSQ